MDLLSFLSSCNLEAVISHPDSDEKALRCYELLQRTNQLNLSGRRYAKEEFMADLKENMDQRFAVSVEDRFGTYGCVAFISIELDAALSEAVVCEFAMSCRVAGKYVESAILNWMKNRYAGMDIVFDGINNEKNGLLIRSLKNIGMKDECRKEHELKLRLRRGEEPKNHDVVAVQEDLRE